jgi:small conductance mechanosensitive channel
MPRQPPLLTFTPEALWARYGEDLIAAALNVIAALAILVLGLWFAALVARGIRRWARRSTRLDLTLGVFFASLARYVIIAVVIIAVLQRFGIQTTSIVAVLGAATLAIGLALQGTLSNVAAGVMLVLFRPYRIGDQVELAGRAGTVRDVNIFTTELATSENVKVVLPNGQCWGAAIVNFSAHERRQIELTLNLPYTADLNRALAIVEAVLKADPRTLDIPAPPSVAAANLGPGLVMDILARAWVRNTDYQNARASLIRELKAALDKEGLTVGTKR